MDPIFRKNELIGGLEQVLGSRYTSRHHDILVVEAALNKLEKDIAKSLDYLRCATTKPGRILKIAVCGYPKELRPPSTRGEPQVALVQEEPWAGALANGMNSPLDWDIYSMLDAEAIWSLMGRRGFRRDRVLEASEYLHFAKLIDPAARSAPASWPVRLGPVR